MGRGCNLVKECLGRMGLPAIIELVRKSEEKGAPIERDTIGGLPISSKGGVASLESGGGVNFSK